MEFVTIHELSRQFNITSRVVRLRLRKLIVEGKLKEGADFVRDDFKDEQHFIWKINPLSFMRETGMKRVTPPPTPVNHPLTAVNETPSPGNQTGNSLASDNHLANQNAPAENSAPTSAIPPVNHSSATVNQTPQTVNKPVNQSDDNAAARAEDRAFEREMIDFLKEQIRVKDEQIREQGKQLKDAHDLNNRLNSTLLLDRQKIETLLRLTGGKMEMADAVVKTGEASAKREDSATDIRQAA